MSHQPVFVVGDEKVGVVHAEEPGGHALTGSEPVAEGFQKLQLTMVLAFSEWWRNSIRERSVAGQAKARAEGRFPGRRPSLNERQREYIRAERSKGVSQRDLAKRLEVSRWTIQQVDR